MSDKVYDLSQLEELGGGDAEFVAMMVATFLEHTPGQLDEMKNAHSSGDLATLGAIAHKIKPNVDMFGINAITQDIRDLEQMGKEGINNDDTRAKLQKVDQELQIAFEQLKQL
ncbi:Hpt domain-containing protein [Croceimicrobium sp.]|uniref:Hpt domain-containing protein n=1 Tax=Croceimicrobium sp. TaxID=2828340 RepID=UPI003BAC89BD